MILLTFEWLLGQQLLLSSLLLSLILLERFGLGVLRPSFVYKLVIIIPLAMLLANLPSAVKPFQNNAISHFLVKPNLEAVTSFGITWFNAYLVLTSLLMITVVVIHKRFLNSLRLKPLVSGQLATLVTDNTNRLNGQNTYVSSFINTPMIVGLFRSKLVLPSEYQQQFNSQALSMIIEHESIHMQRKDNLANAMFLFASIVLWFNPLAWLAYGSFRRLQELSCDQKVLHNKTKAQQVLYSKALIDCAAIAPTRLMAYSHYGDKQMILQRITNIKHSNKGSSVAKGSILLATGLLLSGLVIAKGPASENDLAKEVHPIVRVAPVYPAIAAEQGLTGVVTVKYDISPEGLPTNLSVVSAKPERIFNREAKKAVAQWRYTPSNAGHTDMLVQLEFALD